ncbi:MAG: hypothetical protein E7312_05100 [Clostridiales bacterium]|nr:hypothetical protein [Clostridiales bacterium]
MKQIYPNYYDDFTCIADKCKHNCCIGWEIDIDDDTMDIYDSIGGEFGKKLHQGIDRKNQCFKLCENDRCAFLNEKGLCDIILNLGEGALCDICNDHPRFRNFYSDQTEVGLGMCCEEAGRIILTSDILPLIEEEDDEECGIPSDDETELLNAKAEMLALLCDKSISYAECEKMLLNMCEGNLHKLSPKELADILRGLERLDNEWDKSIDILKGANEFSYLADEYSKRLASYFIFRHMNDIDSVGRVISFCVTAVRIIGTICKQGNVSGSLCDIIEVARAFSAEIEYSDENINILLDI